MKESEKYVLVNYKLLIGLNFLFGMFLSWREDFALGMCIFWGVSTVVIPAVLFGIQFLLNVGMRAREGPRRC